MAQLLTTESGLVGTLICEVSMVHYGMENLASKDSDMRWLPNNVGLLRYTYCALGAIFLLYSFFGYMDYKVLHHELLHSVAKDVKHLASRQANVEDLLDGGILQEVRNLASRVERALGIPKNASESHEDGRTQRQTRFVTPRKSPFNGPPKANVKPKRDVQTAPY
ncbi:unnamed protein product [Calypogeia fissa]